MSQENVEIVRQILEAFNRRDWAAWDDVATEFITRRSSGATPLSSPAAASSMGWESAASLTSSVENTWHVDVEVHLA